jgi:hypothetical protein
MKNVRKLISLLFQLYINGKKVGHAVVPIDRPAGGWKATTVLQGSILQNSISAKNFFDTFSSSYLGQIFAQKQYNFIWVRTCYGQ